MGAQQSVPNERRQLVAQPIHCSSSTSHHSVMSKVCAPLNGYPYPRTHSLVVVPSTRPAGDEETTAMPKQRPPLNRAIPPIPESKSNESIMTQASERRDESLTDCIPSTSRDPTKAQHDPVNSVTNKCDCKRRKSSSDDRSIVIENKLAQNLASKTATSVMTKHERASETPKSPLMSVAHSVRTRLTKLSIRFNRTDSRRAIRYSSSLSSMRKPSSGKSTEGCSNDATVHSKLFKKSASMESRPTPYSTSSESIKSSIPVKTPISSATPVSLIKNDAVNSAEANAAIKSSKKSTVSAKILKLRPSLPNSADGTCLASESAGNVGHTVDKLANNDSGYRSNSSLTSEAKTSSNRAHRSLPHPSRPPPNPPSNPIITPAARITSKVTATLSGRNSTKSNTKATNPSDTIKKEKKTKLKAEVPLNRRISNGADKANSALKRVERSFIPLIASTPKRVDIPSMRRHSRASQAPLAECESSRVGNSPAVEMPPSDLNRLGSSPGQRRRLVVKALHNSTPIEEESTVNSPDKPLHNAAMNNVICGEVDASNVDVLNGNVDMANANIDITVARTAVSEDSQASAPSNKTEGGVLTSPAASSAETNRGLIDDEIKDQPLLVGGGFDLSDALTPSSHWRQSLEMADVVLTNQIGSQTSPVLMIESVNMTSSGYMTSSGLLGSAHNDGDSHSEMDSVDEQLSNLTMCNAASRSRSRRAKARTDIDDDAFVAVTQPGPSQPKQQKIERPERCVAFPDVASYESACQDVLSIKQQLSQLHTIINSSAPAGLLTSSGSDRVDVLSLERLRRENDALRKELAEKDRIISSLKARITMN